jgi:hypothetical protein
MKKYTYFLFILFLVVGIMSAAPVRSQTRMEITQTSGSILIQAPRPAGIPPTTITIQRVLNVRGNNPLNQEEPVNNFNGQTYDTLEEMVRAQQGNTKIGISLEFQE